MADATQPGTSENPGFRAADSRPYSGMCEPTALCKMVSERYRTGRVRALTYGYRVRSVIVRRYYRYFTIPFS